MPEIRLKLALNLMVKKAASVAKLKKNAKPAYHPLYWPVWLGIGLFWLITQITPYRILMFFGRQIGHCIYLFPSRAKLIVQKNIQLCFADLNQQQQNKLVKENFAAYGMAVFETALGWWGTNKRLQSLCHLEGIEHFHNAQKQGKGIIIIGGHFTCLELAGRLFTIRTPIAVIYRLPRHPLLRAILLNGRYKHYVEMYERHNIRGIVRCIKNGTPFWYSPDVDPGRQDGLFSPYFGQQAYSLTATSRLAKMCNAVVLSVSHYRRDDGRGYNVVVHPPLENFPSNDLQTDTDRINQVIESLVKEKPEQYLWTYRRFKTRPKDHAKIY